MTPRAIDGLVTKCARLSSKQYTMYILALEIAWPPPIRSG